MTLLFIVAGLPQAGADAGQDCDRLAALEADPLRKAAPVPFADLDAVAVIRACQAAIFQATGQSSDDLGRYHLQLGRGLLRAGQGNAATEQLQYAADWGYPAGHFALATLYFLGDDVAADHTRAAEYFERAWQQGVAWAAYGLAELYDDPMSELFNEAAARQWRARWRQARDETAVPAMD